MRPVVEKLSAVKTRDRRRGAAIWDLVIQRAGEVEETRSLTAFELSRSLTEAKLRRVVLVAEVDHADHTRTPPPGPDDDPDPDWVDVAGIARGKVEAVDRRIAFLDEFLGILTRGGEVAS